MRIVAHDPFISADSPARFGVELLSLDELCAAADYLTLHLPSTPETQAPVQRRALRTLQAGHPDRSTRRAASSSTKRRCARAIEQGIVAGAGLDVFEKEPPADWALAQLPQVVATPHIAASTEEAQELVGLDTAGAVRDFLRDGVVRNAVNFPSVHPDELQRLQPWIRLADQLGAMASQMGAARIEAHRPALLRRARRQPRRRLLASSAAAGVLRPILSGGVSIVNARSVARAARHRHRRVAQRAAAALHQPRVAQAPPSDGERWAEGTVFEPNSPRLVSVRGVDVEAPLAGTMLIIANDDQPGVIGEVGTILGRHGVNIANFALGRNDTGAIGVVNVDEEADKRQRSTPRWAPSGESPRSATPGLFGSDADVERARMDAEQQSWSRPPPVRRPRETHRPLAFDGRPVHPANRQPGDRADACR